MRKFVFRITLRIFKYCQNEWKLSTALKRGSSVVFLWQGIFFSQLNFAFVEGFFSLHRELLISSGRIKKTLRGVNFCLLPHRVYCFQVNCTFFDFGAVLSILRSESYGQDNADQHLKEQLFIFLICNWLTSTGAFYCLKITQTRKKMSCQPPDR